MRTTFETTFSRRRVVQIGSVTMIAAMTGTGIARASIDVLTVRGASGTGARKRALSIRRRTQSAASGGSPAAPTVDRVTIPIALTVALIWNV